MFGKKKRDSEDVAAEKSPSAGSSPFDQVKADVGSRLDEVRAKVAKDLADEAQSGSVGPVAKPVVNPVARAVVGNPVTAPPKIDGGGGPGAPGVCAKASDTAAGPTSEEEFVADAKSVGQWQWQADEQGDFPSGRNAREKAEQLRQRYREYGRQAHGKQDARENFPRVGNVKDPKEITDKKMIMDRVPQGLKDLQEAFLEGWREGLPENFKKQEPE